MYKFQTSKVEILDEGEDFVNWDRDINPPGEFFKDTKDIKDIREIASALDSFQIRRTFHIGGRSLTQALVALRERMPQILQDKAMLSLGFQFVALDEPLGAYPGQHGYFSCSDEKFEETIEDEKEPLMINKEYIMWTVNTGESVLTLPFEDPPSPPRRQHYVTIVMHLEPSDPDNKPDVRDRVTDLAIADPLHNQHANPEESRRFKDRIIYRLQKYMSKFTFAPDCEWDLWTPPMEQDLVEENFATPYMAYSVTSQLYDRIAEMEFSGSGFDPEVFFRPTLPYFDPDRVRTEIWGLLIAKYMALMDWKVRIGMVPTVYAVDPQLGAPTSPASLKFSEKPPVGHNWRDSVPTPGTHQAGQAAATKGDEAGAQDIDDLFGDDPAATSPAAEKMDIDGADADADADADVPQALKPDEAPPATTDCHCCPSHSEPERKHLLSLYLSRKHAEIAEARQATDQALDSVAALPISDEDEEDVDALRGAVEQASAAVADAEVAARRVGAVVPGGDLDLDARARAQLDVQGAAEEAWGRVLLARRRLVAARVRLAGRERVGGVYAGKQTEGKGKGKEVEVESDTETESEDDDDDSGTYFDPKEIITVEVPPYHI
ncbi:hypothetical protein F4775DRAFT_604998 [Biscogniauxia sp. FL1348]|nr:hypothetical protein F4775DRAFT_604998 [Biscogniauxia sp. FL1348]